MDERRSFASERFDSPHHSSHVAQLFALGVFATMKDKLKSVGSFLLGFCCLVVLMFIIMTFARGGVWLSERVYPWLVDINGILFLVVVLLLLPLAIFRRTRPYAGAGIYFSSFVFGLTLFVWSILITYSIWGVVGIVTGLLLMGFGIVPVAILACLFHGLWSVIGQLLLLLAISMGSRFFGIYLMMRSADREAAVSEALDETI